MNEQLEDRKEPKVEVNPDTDEYLSPTSYGGPRPSLSLKKMGLVFIVLIGTFGMGFGLWILLQSGMVSGKKQLESPELLALRGEFQKLKGEIDPLKKEIQSLKEELASFQDRTKILQGQISAFKDQLSGLANKKDSKGYKKPAPKVVIYKIKKGDTLVSVAKKFRVRPDDLRGWNRLSLKSKLNPGQIITIYSPTP
ncbi:MAG: LysM peptidoglycan-binding domain-containing protein [Deltaproteobacteria bacterium]|nr:LysM peptidoglycan-binding domain-containing protein [Deltaproteobacteria bacterium]